MRHSSPRDQHRTPGPVLATGIWKSGTNLLVKLCAGLGAEWTRPGLAASLLYGRLGLVRRLVRGPHPLNGPPLDIGLETYCPVGRRWLSRVLRRSAGRCLSGHAAWSPELRQLLDAAGARTLCIVRDPRDVALSFAHWIITRSDYYAHPAFAGLDLDHRVLRLVEGAPDNAPPLAPFSVTLDRAAGWLVPQPRTVVLRFEDLVGAAGGGDADRQHQAVADAAAMLGVEDIDPAGVAASLFGGTPTFRSGQIGAWRRELQPRTADRLERAMGDRLRAWGYA